VAEAARATGARVEEWEKARGPAAARNSGAAVANGDLLLFIDADVLVPRDLVAVIQGLFACEPGLAAAFGSYDDRPEAPGLLSQYRNLLHHWVHQQGSEEAFTFWAGCGAVRRQVFLELGGFDEGYRGPAVEDIELGYRMRRAGHRIRLLKSLQVKHLKRWRLGDMVATDLFRRAIPWTQLLLRGGGVTNDLNINRSGRASVALTGLGMAGLGAAVVWPPALVGTGLAAGALVLANAQLYRFFLQKRGPAFTLGAVGCHWLYFVVCGLGLVLGAARHFLGGRRREMAAGRRPGESHDLWSFRSEQEYDEER